MNSLLHFLLLTGLAGPLFQQPAAPQAGGGTEAAKLRERIDQLERELVRLTRELHDLRSKLGPVEPPPKTADVLRSLDQAYERLRKDVLDQETLFRAVRSFNNGDATSALAALRIGRHRAAVPLILKDMVRREAQPKFQRDDLKAYRLTLALLTGEDVESVPGSAHRLVEEWWRPRQEKFVTDIGKMSPGQVAHVARRLREITPPPEGYRGNGPAYNAHAVVYALFAGSDRPERGGPQPWFAEELHPALGPAFLAGMGYRKGGAGGQDVAEVPYQLVHILAAMRKNGALPQLDKVAEDTTQNSAVRLVCLMALRGADEGVRVPAVLSVLAREKKLDRRLAALEFLYYADDLEPAAPYLLEVLDDPSGEVRTSALSALSRRPPPRLLKRLQEMAEAKHQERVLEIIAAMGTFEAQQYLAGYLARTMNDRPRTERIHDALWAFQRATGQSWVSAGRSPFDYYHQVATRALAWWKAHGGK